MIQPTTTQDLICLSHLRWDFVYQRTHHLMSRFARTRRVFFVEEVVDSPAIELKMRLTAPNIWVIQPHLPFSLARADQHNILRYLLDELRYDREIHDYVLWYDTPLALPWTDHLTPRVVVYDCMEAGAGFSGDGDALTTYERTLLEHADVLFTRGTGDYERKRHEYRNVHCFPDSIQVAHFARARERHIDPADQADIPHPRLGIAGPIDEHTDVSLISALCTQLPDMQIVVLGAVAQIDPDSLPRHPNLHYLGAKAYEQLPEYMAGWDAAVIPLIPNEATGIIGATSASAYLAAGLPVVSTPLQDVLSRYGERGLVQLVEGDRDLKAAVTWALMQKSDVAWREAADSVLAPMSWDATHAAMDAEIRAALALAAQSDMPISILDWQPSTTTLSA